MEAESADVEFSHEEWGDGQVVSHWGDGKWIMYDPDEDAEDLDDWR